MFLMDLGTKSTGIYTLNYNSLEFVWMYYHLIFPEPSHSFFFSHSTPSPSVSKIFIRSANWSQTAVIVLSSAKLCLFF